MEAFVDGSPDIGGVVERDDIAAQRRVHGLLELGQGGQREHPGLAQRPGSRGRHRHQMVGPAVHRQLVEAQRDHPLELWWWDAGPAQKGVSRPGAQKDGRRRPARPDLRAKLLDLLPRGEHAAQIVRRGNAGRHGGTKPSGEEDRREESGDGQNRGVRHHSSLSSQRKVASGTATSAGSRAAARTSTRGSRGAPPGAAPAMPTSAGLRSAPKLVVPPGRA